MNYYHDNCGFNVATLNCRSLRSELKKNCSSRRFSEI